LFVLGQSSILLELGGGSLIGDGFKVVSMRWERERVVGRRERRGREVPSVGVVLLWFCEEAEGHMKGEPWWFGCGDRCL
jgi:hypothetical protein